MSEELEALGLATDIHDIQTNVAEIGAKVDHIDQIKEAVSEMRDTLNGKGQETGLVGRVKSLEDDKIDPRVFERISVKMNIICWIGGIIGGVLIVGIASGWVYGANVRAADAVLMQPSLLSNSIKFGPDEAVPRMGNPAEYVNMSLQRKADLSAIERNIRTHVKEHGPIDMQDGTTFPRPTPSYTRAAPVTKTE